MTCRAAINQAEPAPAMHAPSFTEDLPLGQARCEKCGKVITKEEFVRERCEGKA